jgi:hypothetical protein
MSPLNYALSNLATTLETFNPFATPAAEVRIAPLDHFYLKTMVMAGDPSPAVSNLNRLLPQFRGSPVLEGRREEGVAFVLDLTLRKRANIWSGRCSKRTRLHRHGGDLLASAAGLGAGGARHNGSGARQSRYDGLRAGNVGIRAIIRNLPARRDQFNIDDAVIEVVALTRRELLSNGVSSQTKFAQDLPLITVIASNCNC